MRYLAVIFTLFLGITLLEPIYQQAYANNHHKKTHLHKKKAKKGKKKVAIKPSRNINSPQEGELLKLEGMVKDINEQ
ncbi:hypothetical protein [Hydrogenobacter hydrogenophilus]|uniref:Uncharacterized protein n=1 Tax=Hydrogenobacter hydrogenophilus TaxID=35835 RepID=A0A285NZ34_9AQUI|nr:hypothetical protein [Hydrogenobacter hydrogenophilus]SNZ14730.1 hypothetical protein SAMN06265353_1182 [Hydrogenobacter hydrogenophilus]